VNTPYVQLWQRDHRLTSAHTIEYEVEAAEAAEHVDVVNEEARGTSLPINMVTCCTQLGAPSQAVPSVRVRIAR